MLKEKQRKLLKGIQKFMDEKKERIDNKKTKEYRISNYFKNKVKDNGFVLSDKNWEKTKDAAIKIAKDYSEITISEWEECIDWCFSNEKYEDSYWCRVPIVSLETVIKAFSVFKTGKEMKKMKKVTPKRKRIQYGSL
jgi:hypothetical protein